MIDLHQKTARLIEREHVQNALHGQDIRIPQSATNVRVEDDHTLYFEAPIEGGNGTCFESQRINLKNGQAEVLIKGGILDSRSDEYAVNNIANKYRDQKPDLV